VLQSRCAADHLVDKAGESAVELTRTPASPLSLACPTRLLGARRRTAPASSSRRDARPRRPTSLRRDLRCADVARVRPWRRRAKAARQARPPRKDGDDGDDDDDDETTPAVVPRIVAQLRGLAYAVERPARRMNFDALLTSAARRAGYTQPVTASPRTRDFVGAGAEAGRLSVRPKYFGVVPRGVFCRGNLQIGARWGLRVQRKPETFTSRGRCRPRRVIMERRARSADGGIPADYRFGAVRARTARDGALGPKRKWPARGCGSEG